VRKALPVAKLTFSFFSLFSLSLDIMF
jgi:hypothetical protein